MRFLFALLATLFASQLFAGGDPTTAEAEAPVITYKVEDYSYEDVIENLKMAITDRGMLVSGTLHVSDMLNRTAPDLGFSQIYKKAESIEFCSAVMSHKMTQVSPTNLVICPFTIAVFIKNDEPKQIYVAFRRQYLAGESLEVTQAIFNLLDGIVTEAIE